MVDTGLVVCILILACYALSAETAKSDFVTEGKLAKTLKKFKSMLKKDPSFIGGGGGGGGNCQDYLEDAVKLKNGYYLAFRGTAGSEYSVYAGYTMAGHDDHCWQRAELQCGCLTVDGRKPCHRHYKSRIVSLWSLMPIITVRVSVYNKGKERVFFEFNGKGSTYTNFFSADRLTDSSYSDADRNTTYNYFSIEGHVRNTEVRRRFFINRQYSNKCTNDEGWLVAVDGNDGCSYTDSKSYPVFMYATGGTSQKWASGSTKKGDVLAVAVKFKKKFDPNSFARSGTCMGKAKGGKP